MNSKTAKNYGNPTLGEVSAFIFAMLGSFCEEKGFTLHLTENANHSLECGKARKDIKTIRKVMKTVEEFIWRGADHPLSK